MKVNPSMFDDKGPSLMLYYNEKAESNLSAIVTNKYEPSYEVSVQYNSALIKCYKAYNKRNESWVNIDKSKDFSKLLYKLAKLPR